MQNNKPTPEDHTSYDSDVSEFTGLDDLRAEKKDEGVFGKLVRLISGASPEAHDKGRELRRAVRAQDIKAVRQMIASGYGVNQSQEASLACIASRRANLEMLKLLVEAGVDINTPDRRSQTSKARTPLQEASRKGWIEGVKLLLELGADIDACEEGDVTALHIAARMGHADVVKLLLQHRADPCGSKASITSPLHETSSLPIAKMLLQAGAMVDQRDRNKCTPLHLQAYAGHPEIMKLLLDAGADPHSCDRKGRPPVFLLGGRGDVMKCYKMFKDLNVNFNARDLNENTIAHSLAHRSNSEELLHAVFDDAPLLWQAKNLSGQTPLDILAFRGQLDWVKRFRNKLDALPPSMRSRQQGLFDDGLVDAEILLGRNVRR